MRIIHDSKIAGIAVSLPIPVYEDVLQNEPYATQILPPKDHAFKVAIQEMFGLAVEEVQRTFHNEKIANVNA